jgi:hypothetical protein
MKHPSNIHGLVVDASASASFLQAGQIEPEFERCFPQPSNLPWAVGRRKDSNATPGSFSLYSPTLASVLRPARPFHAVRGIPKIKEKSMVTKNDLTAAEQSASARPTRIKSAQPGVLERHSLRRRLLKLGLAASVATLDRVDAPQIIAFAQGYSSENTANLLVNGPGDVLRRQLVFQPGRETARHTHPEAAAFSRPLLGREL